MEDFVILDCDENAIIDDATNKHFTTKILPLCGGNYWKVELQTDSSNYNVAIYGDQADAQHEVKRLYKTLKKFRQGKYTEINAFAFKPSDVTALELLNLCEEYNQDVTTDTEKDFYACEKIDSFIDELVKILLSMRWKNLQKMKSAGDEIDNSN